MRLVIKYITIIFSLLFVISCSQSVRFSSNQTRTINKNESVHNNGRTNEKEILKNDNYTEQTGMIYRGIASYYGDKFEGRTTASGENYSPEKFTAAHKTLKFGTKLKVTNLANSNTVYVVVNDRGPNVPDRIIDLSKAAAIMLDMLGSGLAEVEIEIIE